MRFDSGECPLLLILIGPDGERQELGALMLRVDISLIVSVAAFGTSTITWES
jgi:hypothetical protein